MQPLKRLLALAALVLVVGLVWFRLAQDGGGRASAETGYRTAAVDLGTVIAQVSTAGSVSPTTTVIVGSQLSGQVVEIFADYNSEVKTGQILARLNSDQIRAKLDGARADFAQARAARAIQDAQLEKGRAEIARATANAADVRAQFDKSSTQFADAAKTLERQTALAARGIVSVAALQNAKTLYDTLQAQRESAKAQIESSKAQIDSLRADLKGTDALILSNDAQIQQRAAVVRQIEVDLANTEVRSPVDGVVIQRNVELGMPVAASLQAPTLFLVAQDLRKIEIQANVDEADVGRVKPGQTVSFNVNAYPGRNFTGAVKQVRLGSQTVQNVVIYTTVIEVDNPNLDLRPGMTANLRILTERRENVLRLPNAALRWRPPVTGDSPLAASGPSGADSPSGPFAGPAGGEGQGAGRGGRGGGAGGGPFLGALNDRMRGELDLTTQQLQELDKVMADLAVARPPAGAAAPSSGERQQRGRETRDAFIDRVNAFLSPEQRVKFRDMRQDMRGDRPATVAGVPGRVYKLDEKGQPVSALVRLGANDGAFTEVLSGLNAGAAVIVGGAPPNAGRSGLGGMRFGF